MDHNLPTISTIPAFNFRTHSPDGATTDCSGRHIVAAYYDPKRMKAELA